MHATQSQLRTESALRVHFSTPLECTPLECPLLHHLCRAQTVPTLLGEPRWSPAGGLPEGLEMSVFSHGVCFASEPYDPADMGPITVSASTTVTPDPARAGALLPVRSRAARDIMCSALDSTRPAKVRRVVWLRQLQMLAKSKWSAMRAVGARQPEDDSEDDQCRLLQSS